MLIYIASAYGRRRRLSSVRKERNVQKSIEAGRQLILKGHTPFLPLLYHFVHRDWSETPDEDKWHRICLAWLVKCQAVLRLPCKSSGADDEVELGKALGLKIYYDIEEVEDEYAGTVAEVSG